MHRLRAIAAYLASLWGVLSGAAILFPGAASLLKLEVAPANSRLVTWYPLLGTIVALFLVLLQTSFLDRLSDLTVARRTGVRAMLVALVAVFCLLGVRSQLLDVEDSQIRFDSAMKVTIFSTRARGIIKIREIPSDSLVSVASDGSIRPERQREFSDPWDLVALLLYVTVFGALSVAFGSLGLHSFLARPRHADGDARSGSIPPAT